ncbi:hypothetical protein ACHOLT_19605 [Desulfitobacterium sp. Sab5]|uniref:hypothetical protein n=1 Tax=Desulfitobacterium nosdiversum TaxID=3375356 RepID=UPI003CF3DD13
MDSRLIKYAGILLIAFVLTACYRTPQSLLYNETLKQQRTQVEAGMSSNIVEEKELFQYRFYSPNKAHYISEHLDYQKSVGEPLPVKTQLYYGENLIDTASYPFGYEHKQKKAHVVWIDNKNIIINEIYIFNIETMTKDPIKFPKDFRDSEPILSYQLDPTSKTIAYMCFRQSDNLKGVLKVSLYNLEKNSWENIFSEEISWMPDWGYDSGISQLLWDKDGKLYFDYPITNEYTQVIQYDPKTNKIMNLKPGFKLFDASPDKKYFIIEKQETSQSGVQVNFYVIESNTLEIVYKLSSNRYTWSSETHGELAVLTYNSTESNSKNVSIELISLDERKIIKTIKDNRFKIPKDTIALIDSYEHNYVLNLGEKIYLIKSD